MTTQTEAASAPTAPGANVDELEALVARLREELAALRAEIGKTIVGQEEIIEGVIMTVLGGGHALLEGVPGLPALLRRWPQPQPELRERPQPRRRTHVRRP